MATISVLLLPIITVLFILASFLEFHLVECQFNGFTTNLIRRDYPQKSKFEFDDVTSWKSHYFEWLSESINRSLSRAAYFNHVIKNKQSMSSLSETIEAPIIGIDGEYVMEVNIGTPPIKIVAIADTGSDVTWTQCQPCLLCFKQNDPLFDPRNTSTYRKLSCESQPCRALEGTGCDNFKKCDYQVTYGDRSQSHGVLSVDTFTFSSGDGKNISFPNTVFGCGRQNNGSFNQNTSGIIGLGGGALSIVNQFSSKIAKKFSYCLVPIGKSSSESKITFGVDALPPDSEIETTPLIKGPIDTFYFITLEDISIKNVEFSDEKTRGSLKVATKGNMIIDSGTTLSLLPESIYNDLRSKLVETIIGKPTGDPSGILDLCYLNAPDLAFPDLIFQFTDASVLIPKEHAFLEVANGVTCLMMLSAGDNIAILGNLSQMDYLIQYDIDNQKLSFVQKDCALN